MYSLSCVHINDNCFATKVVQYSLSIHVRSSIPEDIHRILTLQLLDLRLNCINVDLPSTISELHNFVSLNIRYFISVQLPIEHTME